jgi:hypothetical protein
MTDEEFEDSITIEDIRDILLEAKDLNEKGEKE